MRRRALLLLASAPLLLGVERPPGLADVTHVRRWSYAGYTRVVIETTRPVPARLERLPADASAGRPERLYVDLAGAWVGKRFAAPIPVGDGLLQAVRVGQHSLDATRVVLDLERYDHHRVLHLSGPPRVVIDVFGPRAAELPAPAPHEPEQPAPPAEAAPGPRLAAELRPLRTVVIDPGHGGHDPGASGRGGAFEKDVTLRIARALRPRLEAEGFRVVSTRDDDRTLGLEERTAIAEGVRGDLFVSIHANASPKRRLQGVETFYLDKSHERHTLRVAAIENGVAPADLDPLQRTLATFRASETSVLSGALARAVQRELVSGLRARYPGVRDLGVRTGPFYVLFLSSMPSILVEVGFLTHVEEGRRLASAAYADLVAERIARGIARYRDARGTLVAGDVP